MKTRPGTITAAALAAAILAAPLALAANSTGNAFMRKAIEGNLDEIKVGELAQQKGATEAVRQFGTVLEQDHSAANEQAMSAISSMGATAPSAPNRQGQAEYERLAALSGVRFDRAFVKEMVKDHRKDIAVYRKEASTRDGPAASYARQSLPVLHKHLQLAESLERHPSG